uniref:Equilibrative nucleotide transporter 8 n=1 Tax=Kalanchoe fedtschenkoi TaxID=63787 RepID=A0A7N0V2J6_KALFE
MQNPKKDLGEHDQALYHTEPHETCRIAYVIHFLLGAGNLLPWNAFISAADYFGYIYPSHHVEKVFAVAYMGSSLIVLVAMMCFGGRLSFRWRMNVGFSMFIISLLATPLMDWNRRRSEWSGHYGMTVAAVSVCGLADGLIGGSLLGSAGKLPKQYMQAVFAGTASSGFLVCILRIVTKASLPHTPQGLRTSVHFYFIVSTIILLFCIACGNVLLKLPVMEQNHGEFHLGHSNLRPNFWQVAQKIKAPALGVFMIYTVTLSIFPGFLAENLKSKVLRDWYPVLLITTYNGSDLVGKCLTAIYTVKSIKKATWGCLARLVMYPLFATCLHGPKWLRTELPVAVLTFILGLTNGYLTSLIMILTPKSVPNSEAEVAALVMAVSLAVGLLSGSIVGWLWII